MATQVQNRRGSTAEHSTFTGAVGEVTVDTDKEVVVVHDGTTAGGYPQMRENGSQNLVTTGAISGARLIPTGSTVPLNGLYLPAANSVGVTSNSTERLRITSTGRVGLGELSPVTTFDLNGAFAGNAVAVPALNIDCSLGNYFTKTISANSTFTVSNVPANRNYAFTLELQQTSGTVTWFSGVVFPNNTAPTLTTGRTHLFMFQTDNGGTRWRASSLINYTN